MNERCLMVLDWLNRENRLMISDLSRRLGVSAVTVRKDLAALERKGLLLRQHGFVVRVSHNDIGYRMTFDYEVKRRIAKKAAGLVSSGEAVMIESGSTCAMLAEELVKSSRDITIITNSAFIAGYVRSFPGARIVLLGGAYDPDAQVTSGPLVGKCAAEFFVERFFIGTDGYDPDQGFTNADMLRAEAVRAMASSAKQRIILTDSSKFNKRGVVQLMPAHMVTGVITDDVPDNCREALLRDGVTITIAP